jgi:hypothetical protein
MPTMNDETDASRGMEYPDPLPETIPPDRFLVHNNSVRASRRQDTSGAPYWLQPHQSGLEACRCGWAPHLGTHYRVA